MKSLIPVDKIANAATPVTLSGVPQGMEALALAEIARAAGPLAHIISDGQRMADLEQNLAFFAPDIPVLTLPGWDCLPYDRVSPGADVSARRLAALSALAQFAEAPHPAIVLVTVNAMLQRVPPKSVVSSLGLSARAGHRLKMEDLAGRLAQQGFERMDTVREVGEFAVRGGILDVFVPGADEPVRLDFFGDTLESIRHFDPASQRTTTTAKEFSLNAMSEVTLEPETISRFRRNYLAKFGAANRDDALYVAISEGRRYPGMEHWLPLFHDEMATVFDYLTGLRISGDHMLAEAASERRAQIVDHYEARLAAQSIEKDRGVQATPYKAIEPDQLYLDTPDLLARLDQLNAIRLTPFNQPETAARRVIELATATGPRWAKDAEADKSPEGERVNLFAKLVDHVGKKREQGHKVLITAWTEGSLDRLLQVTEEHGLKRVVRIHNHAELDRLKPGEAAAAVLAIEGGYEIDDLVVIGEQDVLGDRLVRRAKRKRRGADYISEVSGLDEGDYVVHAEHGIGQFVGLRTIEAAGAPHACLELHYASDAKLFLPVENIELLTRYGSDSAQVQL
uniref:CarD family transcriptional regulator n=1 Tax=Hoeflea sp. TaxID=1940281 RepID=UPI002AFEE194